MPEETIYRRQVQTRPAEAMPLARAEDYGAGLAEQVGETAGNVNRRALENYKLDREETRNAEWARLQHGFGVLREEADAWTREGRKDQSPGHVTRMRAQLEPKLAGLLENVTEDEVRRRGTATMEEWAGRYLQGEGDFAEASRIKGLEADEIGAANIGTNRLRYLTDPSQLPGELAIGHERIDGYDLPDDVRRKWHDDWDQTASYAYLQGLNERDPVQTTKMVEQGLFDHLDPDKVQAILNGAQVGIRSQQVAADRQAAVAATAAKEAARTLITRSAGGAEVPVDDLEGAIAELRRLAPDDTSLIEELINVGMKNEFARVWQPALPRQREQRMAELNRKANRNANEDRELDWLQRHGATLDNQFNADPVSAMTRFGGSDAPPDLDWSNPDSIAARVQWSDAVSGPAGRPIGVLSRNEAREIGAIWGTGGRQDQLEVMRRLGSLPGPKAAATARLVLPNDPVFPFMVNLPQDFHAMAIDGRDALKAHPDLLSTKKLDPDIGETVERYDRRFREALKVLPEAQREAITRLAGRLTAGGMSGDGITEVTPSRYWQGLNMALGGRQRKDGKWLGGLGEWGGHYFVVPEGVTAQHFADQVVEQKARSLADGTGPVEEDGTPATLSRAYPRWAGNGEYEFIGPDGHALQRADGTVWRVRMAQ